MPRCAVCLERLYQGDKFALVDEFVVHRRCEGGTIRIRAKVRELELDIDRQEGAIRRLEERAEDGRALRARVDNLHGNYMAALREIADLQGQVADRDRQIASERNLRALAELESRSTRVPTTAPAASPQAQEEISSADEDITAARFRLLELD